MRVARFGLMALLPSLALPLVAAAQGRIIPRPCVECPRPGGAQVVRTLTDVRVRLADRVLRYEIEERFRNTGGAIGEADYLFPLPKGAAFQDLALSIDGKMVTGETLDAVEARRIYEEIVMRNRDPALVEWMGHGLLRTRIFPIAPGEERRIIVRFQMVAEREGDALRVDHFGGGEPQGASRPMQEPPRPGRVAAGETRFALEHDVAAAIGRAFSPTHELDIEERGGRRTIRVDGDARNVTVLLPLRRRSEPAITVLSHAPGREDGFALITVSPPDDFSGASRRIARDVTLVLDVSGSMQGPKMDQARAAGKQLLATLRPEDRFRIIDFATDVRTFRDDYVDASAANLAAARRHLDALEPSGSTNIEGALRELARSRESSERLPVVLFMTDGSPTVGQRRAEVLAAMAQPARSGGATRRVFTFGLGADVNVPLLEQMAIEGRGTSQFVRPEESVERAVSLVASRLVDPVLTDVRVRTADNIRLSRVQPPNGTDLFAGQDLVVLARYAGFGQTRLVVEGRRGGAPVTWTTTVTLPDRDRENAFVARLWATQRVGYLSAEKRRGGGSGELDEEIRSLGERFGIPTEFTSYFVPEPGMLTNTQLRGAVGGVAAAGRGAAAPPPAFDAARVAANQRASASIAKAEAAAATGTVTAFRTDTLRSGAPANQLRIDGRSLALRDGVWTDGRTRDGLRIVTVRAYSRAYFDLAERIPALRPLFAVGDRVSVTGRQVVIVVGDGVSTLTRAELDRIADEW